MPEDVKLIDIDRLNRNNSKLVNNLTIQVSTMPIPSATYAGKTVQFVGSSAQYDTGKFYKCVNNGNDNYIWTTVAVESKEIKYTQYETLPTAAQSNVGQIAQYIGDTTNDYKNGYFYKCTGHHTDPNGTIAIVNGVEQFDSFTWEPIDVQGVPIWTGTRAEHTAAETAGTLPSNSLIGITDETPSGGSGSGGSGGAAIDDTTVSTTSTWSSEKLFNILSTSPVLSSFGTAPIASISVLLEKADAGDIDLSDYWAVGDEREVTLSAMEATGVGESHVSQKVSYVILHFGLYKDANDNDVHCIIGIKNCLDEGGYMSDTNTNTGSWDGCVRRTWCNNVYYNAHPSDFKSLLKQFKTITAESYNASTNQISLDHVAFYAEKEVGVKTGNNITYSLPCEKEVLTTFDYYLTSANKIKYRNNDGNIVANGYWLRSPYGNINYWCAVSYNGTSVGGASAGTSTLYGIAPFVCI